jgi:hypothetical protein
MHPPPPQVLHYESAATGRRAKLWQLALTVTQVHCAFLTLALLLSLFSIPRNFREVQWDTLTTPQRIVLAMGYVGLLHVLSWLTSLIALVVLHRIVRQRSAWPLLLLYILPHLALLATHETATLLVGAPTITITKNANTSSLFVVNPLRLAFYAMLSVPLIMITYLLVDHLATRPRARP